LTLLIETGRYPPQGRFQHIAPVQGAAISSRPAPWPQSHDDVVQNLLCLLTWLLLAGPALVTAGRTLLAVTGG
jgi:hypothetical protein